MREGEGEEERKGDRKERQNETETGFLGIRMVGIYIGIVLLGMSRREWERLGIKEERNMILMEKIRLGLGLRIRMGYYFYYYNNNYMKKNNNNYKELESRTFGGKNGKEEFLGDLGFVSRLWNWKIHFDGRGIKFQYECGNMRFVFRAWGFLFFFLIN